MPPKEPSARAMMKALSTMLRVADFFGAGTSTGGLGSTIVMMGLAIVGVVILFGALAAASLIVVVFGLDHGPYSWLGGPIVLAGFVGGLGAAGILMLRIIRRHRRLVALAGFADEPDDSASRAPSPIVAAMAASRRDIAASRLRALDANLASRTGPAEPTAPTEPDADTPRSTRSGPA